MARTLFKISSVIILNPLDVDDRSLLTANADWLADFYRYLSEHDYQVTKLKAERGG